MTDIRERRLDGIREVVLDGVRALYEKLTPPEDWGPDDGVDESDFDYEAMLAAASLTIRCPQCGDAGWVLDAKIDKTPTTLELIPCIYPPCQHSGRDVAVLCLYGEWGDPVLHPSTGGVMSLSHMPPDQRHFRGAPT